MSTSAKPKPPIADEATECRGLIEWRDKVGVRRYPELALLYHIPNGGYRHAWTAHQMRRQGVKPGMPDYHLPVARGQFWSLYIEMKRGDGGLLEPEQSSVHALLRGQGNRVEVCLGWEHAVSVLEDYLARARTAPRGCSRFHSPYPFDD